MTKSRSEPGDHVSLFTGTGAWAEIESDREGQRCVQQQHGGPGQTLRAYFLDGVLVAMTAQIGDAAPVEMPADEVMVMAAQVQARVQARAASTHGTARRYTARR